MTPNLGKQLIFWREQHGYWRRGTGVENATCLGKQVIAVKTLQGIEIVRPTKQPKPGPT